MSSRNCDLRRRSATIDSWLACRSLWCLAVAGMMLAAIRFQSDDAGESGEPFGCKALCALKFRNQAILSLSWAADGELLSIAGFGGPVRVWEMSSGRPWLLDEGGEVKAGDSWSSQFRVACFSPNGRVLAVGTSAGEVAIWDVASRRKISSFEDGVEPIHALAWSPDGLSLIWSKAGKIRYGEVASGRVSSLARWDCPSVKLAYSPDGRLLAGGGGDGNVRIWDVVNGRERLFLRSNLCGVSVVKFTIGSGAVIVCNSSGPSRMWDTASGEELPIPGDAFSSSAITFSPDGGRLAFANRDGTIRVRDVTTGREVGRFTGHATTVSTLAWSPDGRMLASASFDGCAKLWDVSGAL